MAVSSRSNQTIKLIRGLSNRTERERTGLFFVEGLRLVGEAVELEAEIDHCVVAPDLLTSTYGQRLVDTLRTKRIPCLEVTAEVFNTISNKDGPQGIGLVMRQRWEKLEQVSVTGGLDWTVLDSIQDPGNLGTIMRTSEAAGGAGVILMGDATDPYHPSAVRASMGAIFSQHTVKATIEELAAWKSRSRCDFVGTSDAASKDYQSVRYTSPVALIMGSERQGLPAEIRALCDMMVSIRMVGRSDSLNVAVAHGIVMYEVFNQHRVHSGGS